MAEDYNTKIPPPWDYMVNPGWQAAIRVAAREAVRDALLTEEGKLIMAAVAEKAADRALDSMLVKLGIDPSAPGIIRFQQNLQHLDWWRVFVRTRLPVATLSFFVLAAMAMLTGAARAVRDFFVGT